MYITKNKSVALVHKILRIKGNSHYCSSVFTFIFSQNKSLFPVLICFFKKGKHHLSFQFNIEFYFSCQEK